MDVVFLHGWLMGPDLWDAQVAALDGIADTHALAAPAHGAPAPPEDFDMAAWANLVRDELDRRSVERAPPMDQPTAVTTAVRALVEKVSDAGRR